MDREEYYLIDMLKYIFCLGIVFLHAGVWNEFGKIGYFIEKCVALVADRTVEEVQQIIDKNK